MEEVTAKGEHGSPASVLAQEGDLVGAMVRAFRQGDLEAGGEILDQLTRACWLEGRAFERRRGAGVTAHGG